MQVGVKNQSLVKCILVSWKQLAALRGINSTFSFIQSGRRSHVRTQTQPT